ncbi:hypothetical protein IQ268_08720 [Oculatella sp. LEGE 06141]|uniref:hypothetical protein n=1 Tax=Oculatella sp. LEGE 06141 TaxID=1828648 RepID=UPI00187E9B12|nr:hypothetical protein [Oculatella sp. LEGE 06141]MBE9178641.1 hypothetical protein [Oculatella sp. LEGE 06141]
MATKQKLELNDYLPSNWQVLPTANGVRLVAPNGMDAQFFYEGAREYLKLSAQTLGSIELLWDGCAQPIKVEGMASAKSPSIDSYAPSKISPDANHEAVADFIKGKKAEGLIVTITSMVSDKCLLVNDLQVFDRGGGWTGDDWIGLDFKKLWRDSFQIGKTNYYGQLVQAIERDRGISDFHYHIRRPSGALAEYSSSYHFVENFLEVPVRIAVSKVGDWRVIESATDGSETI